MQPGRTYPAVLDDFENSAGLVIPVYNYLDVAHSGAHEGQNFWRGVSWGLLHLIC